MRQPAGPIADPRDSVLFQLSVWLLVRADLQIAELERMARLPDPRPERETD